MSDKKSKQLEYQKKWYSLNKEYHKEYREKNKEKVKNTRLLIKYGISLETYNAMVLQQKQQCACCGVSVSTLSEQYPDSPHGSLVVDHDHETGKVRELLCSKCNTLVGYLEKRKELIPKAYEYINKHK